MEQITQLAKEVEELQKTLLRKQEQLTRITNELSIRDSSGTEVVEVTESIRNGTSIVQETCNTVKRDESKMESTRAQVGEKLPTWAIERYSRQILLPTIGVEGQERICAARVLIVGAGGLGCPAGVYLAGAGIGTIGIVDYDTVDLTNIHRQFLHTEEDQYRSKVESAANSLRSINSKIKVIAYNVQLDSKNALQIASQYDIVLDCTDNVPTRYLLNDLCVLTKIPLISGSALKMEGQLTIYGYRARINDDEMEVSYKGPCYRCIFPSPPPAEAVVSCSANGVAGPVPGTIGSLQALEAIKYIVGQPHPQLLVGRMLLFDGEDMTFRTVKLRPPSAECAACSENATISHLIDYEVFCKAQAKEKEPRPNSHLREREKEKRMTGQSYYGFRTTDQKWIQDVPKMERKMGTTCKSDFCTRTVKKCTIFNDMRRREIFHNFWTLDWREKKEYVRSLVDAVPVKRRRVQLKGMVSRKGGSKMYHLLYGDERLPVCRVMFLNTLGVKEAMIAISERATESGETTDKSHKCRRVLGHPTETSSKMSKLHQKRLHRPIHIRAKHQKYIPTLQYVRSGYENQKLPCSFKENLLKSGSS